MTNAVSVSRLRIFGTSSAQPHEAALLFEVGCDNPVDSGFKKAQRLAMLLTEHLAFWLLVDKSCSVSKHNGSCFASGQRNKLRWECELLQFWVPWGNSSRSW